MTQFMIHSRCLTNVSYAFFFLSFFCLLHFCMYILTGPENEKRSFWLARLKCFNSKSSFADGLKQNICRRVFVVHYNFSHSLQFTEAHLYTSSSLTLTKKHIRWGLLSHPLDEETEAYRGLVTFQGRMDNKNWLLVLVCNPLSCCLTVDF